MSLPKPEVRAEADRLVALFEATGAQRVEADILQPAEVLLDLYGEDIRARAYTTSDPLRGEQMLRPDFTVPVVQQHMAESAEPARYVYAGEVFRRQEEDATRPAEYLQVGYEIFDRSSPVDVEAGLFALFHRALEGLSLSAVIGDIGFLVEGIAGLKTSEARKAALARHIWRPARFMQLLDRFAAPARVTLAETKGPQIGLRRAAEVEARVAGLTLDAETPPLTSDEVTTLKSLLNVSAPAPEALEQLRAIAAQMDGLSGAVTRFEARLAALDAQGIAPESLRFEGSYGRSQMEYYDGFVFGFVAADPDLPTVASGGRYDALTRILGAGRDVPAVGGVIRPEIVSYLKGVRA